VAAILGGQVYSLGQFKPRACAHRQCWSSIRARACARSSTSKPVVATPSRQCDRNRAVWAPGL